MVLMRNGFYRAWLILFLWFYPLMIAGDLVACPGDIPPASLVLLFIGLALQPLSAIGLWRNKSWGIGLLLLAICFCIATGPASAIGCFFVVPLYFLKIVEKRAAAKC